MCVLTHIDIKNHYVIFLNGVFLLMVYKSNIGNTVHKTIVVGLMFHTHHGSLALTLYEISL